MTYRLKQFEIGPMKNFGYLIGDIETKQALIVDPAWDPELILKQTEREGFKLQGMIVTHAHYDHVNAIEDLLGKLDIPVYANRAELAYSKSGNNIVGTLGNTFQPMDSEQSITLGKTKISFLHTPGHTPGSQCIQVGHHLITGDTLFIDGCGRSDLPGGDPNLLFKSLKKIASLSPDIEICPGHDYGVIPSRSLKQEKESNPYLQMENESAFINAVG